MQTPTSSVLLPCGITPKVNFAGASGDYYAPFDAKKSYKKVLPTVGLSFALTDNVKVYGSYTEQQAAPKVDNLYTLGANGALGDVRPETSKSFDGGVRYQSGSVLGQLGGYHTEINNRIVSTRSQDDDVIIDRNVGSVELNGFDAQIGLRPAEPVTVYAFASYISAQLQDNLFVGGTTFFPGAGLPVGVVPTKGKQQVETPKWTWGGRATYETGPFQLGVQAKYTGRRYITDVNDVSTGAFMLIDLDARLDLAKWVKEGTYLQFNVTNLFNEHYFGSFAGTQTDATPGAPGTGTPYASIGAPRAVTLTLRAAF